MRDYRNLEVWEKSHAFVMDVYRSVDFISPGEECADIIKHVKKAAFLIASNIIEGCGKFSNREFSRNLMAALACANEAEYGLILLSDLEGSKNQTYEELLSAISEIKDLLMIFMKVVKGSRRKRY